MKVYQKLSELNIKTIDPKHGFVIHQWHARDAESKLSQMDFSKLFNYNKTLYQSYITAHNKYNFNFPKILHLYWDKSNFSYLNLLTVLSFNKYHYGWKINVYCPLKPNKVKSWKGNEQKDEYIGKDYFNELVKIDNVFIHDIDFDLLNFKYNEASEVIKSDFFRLYILNKYGGLWSDFDIIYTNSIEEYYSTKNTTNKNMVLYRYKWVEANRYVYPVGLFLANPKSVNFKFLS